uniref:Secreted protein n=1 Tax=Panagrellus redivivus TaxID=6233 RepID=A0A7E4ULT5_PANRE
MLHPMGIATFRRLVTAFLALIEGQFHECYVFLEPLSLTSGVDYALKITDFTELRWPISALLFLFSMFSIFSNCISTPKAPSNQCNDSAFCTTDVA